MKEIIKKANYYLLFILLGFFVLHIGKTFLIPIVFASMLAMLMAPVCRKLDGFGLPRALSTLSCVLILLFAILALGAVMGAQIAAFSKDADKIEEKAKEFKTQAQSFIEKEFNITPYKQDQVIKEQTQDAGKKAGGMAAKILAGITSAIAGLVVTLVFTFLFLYSKEKYENFFVKVFRKEDAERVRKIVGEVSHVAQQYLTGRAISITIIAVLYSIGLSIVGIQNAILLGCAAAVLTVIPYVGTVLGGLFPALMALVTEDSMQPAIMAVLVMFIIQTIDNYFIEPNVVGGEVNLSALTSILSIIAGGMIWGVAGMILFLPMVGILKIICDHIPALQPIGYVIGDEEKKKGSAVSNWFKKKFFNKKDGNKK